jgi:hypothetical protein
MGTNRNSICPGVSAVASPLLACICAGALLFAAAAAMAQDAAKTNPPAPAEGRGFFGSIVHWFDEQASNFNSNIKDAGSKFANFGREAGIAAKTTVDSAKDAAGAMVRLPNARVITGHEKCMVAPNGAPDCLAAAMNLCKTKGFESGKSVDMTTAEVCPPKVLLSGRSSGPECHDETFVSRVLCQ